MCLFVWACVYMFMSAREFLCVRVCLCACVHTCVRSCVRAGVCERA